MNKAYLSLRLVLASLSIAVLLSCSKATPSLEGNWILTQSGTDRVAEKDSYFLKASKDKLELISFRTRESVLGERTYRIEGGKLYVENPVEESTILSLSQQRLDLASFNGWTRASFKKADEEAMAHIENLEQPEEASTETPLVEEFEQPSIAGLWEKPQEAFPYPGSGLFVEIGQKHIRAQGFSLLLKNQFDLVGAARPCTYSIDFKGKSVGEGTIFCKHSGKTYSIKVWLPEEGSTDMNLEFNSLKFTLKQTDESRVAEIDERLGPKLKLKRLE